jgi:hypothetical protein
MDDPNELQYLIDKYLHIHEIRHNGFPDNALNLTPEELAVRKVVWIDIVNGKPKAKPE